MADGLDLSKETRASSPLKRRELEEQRLIAEQMVKKLIDGLAPRPHWNVIDLGCGTGRLIEEFLKIVPVSSYFAIDNSDKAVLAVKSHFVADSRVKPILNHGNDFPDIETGSVDLVFAVDVLIHIYEMETIESYFAEVARVLKAGGTFRCNVRRFDPNNPFSKARGGILDGALLGVRKWIERRQKKGTNVAALNGTQFVDEDIKRGLAHAGLQLLEARISGPQIWCTIQS